MASGWKFSVTIPSWTQTTLENDEVVVVRTAGLVYADGDSQYITAS